MEHPCSGDDNQLEREPEANEMRWSEAEYWRDFGAREGAGDVAGADPVWLLAAICDQADDLIRRRRDWGRKYPWHQDLFLVKRLVMLNLALEKVIEARREEARREREGIPF